MLFINKSKLIMLATTPYPYFTKTARRLRTHRHDYSLNVTFFFFFAKGTAGKPGQLYLRCNVKRYSIKDQVLLATFPQMSVF